MSIPFSCERFDCQRSDWQPAAPQPGRHRAGNLFDGPNLEAGVSQWSWTDGHLELLGAHVHLEQRVGEHVAEAAGVEVAVGSPVVIVVVDVGELQAAVLQQLVVVKLLVAHVDLLVPRQNVARRLCSSRVCGLVRVKGDDYNHQSDLFGFGLLGCGCVARHGDQVLVQRGFLVHV